MSSHNSISLASSRQFETRHTQNRIELSNEQAASMANPDPLEISTEEFDQVSVTLSAEQTVQVNLLNSLFGRKSITANIRILSPTTRRNSD